MVTAYYYTEKLTMGWNRMRGMTIFFEALKTFGHLKTSTCPNKWVTCSRSQTQVWLQLKITDWMSQRNVITCLTSKTSPPTFRLTASAASSKWALLKKKNCKKIGLTVVFLRSWISFPPSHLWVMRRIEGSYLKGWRMDCCCHLDLPTRNLDGPPEPEKVFKTVSNSDLFLLYSQDTLQAAVYSNLWEINYFNISWQSK